MRKRGILDRTLYEAINARLINGQKGRQAYIVLISTSYISEMLGLRKGLVDVSGSVEISMHETRQNGTLQVSFLFLFFFRLLPHPRTAPDCRR